jgi:succinyl-diaminopimelate desuccinylase
VEDMWRRLDDRIEGYEEDMVRLQAEMVAIPALGPDNGGQGELEKAVMLESRLKLLSPDHLERIDAPDDRVSSGIRPNLVARIRGRSSRCCWVLSHIDIVPAGEYGLWDSDPFILKREGDYLFGRGVEDNHAGVVASYFAAKAVRDEGLTPEYDMGLILVADEETGSEYGLFHILNTRPDLFSPEDLIIVPDAGDADGCMIEVAEKSMLWVRFTVSGRQCHASTPQLGANTMRAAARMIVALDEQLHASFNARDELFTVPGCTFEPTKKNANVPNVNTVPGEDVFHFDARVLPQYPLSDVKEQMIDIANHVAEACGVTVQVEFIQDLEAPPPTPTNAPVVQALSDAIKRVYGKEARIQGIGGGTVAACFRQRGLSAVVWSTLLNMAHAPNEHVTLTNLKADARILARVFMGS